MPPGGSYGPIYAQPYLDLFISLDVLIQIIVLQTCLKFAQNLFLSLGDAKQTCLEFKRMSMVHLKHLLNILNWTRNECISKGKHTLIHFCVICIPRIIKEIHNEKSYFYKHLKIIICKELIIQFYHN